MWQLQGKGEEASEGVDKDALEAELEQNPPPARLSRLTEITALRFAKAFRSLGIADRSSCSHSALASLAAALAGIPAWAPHISEAMVAFPNSLIEIVSELVGWFESIHFNDNSSLSSLGTAALGGPSGRGVIYKKSAAADL